MKEFFEIFEKDILQERFSRHEIIVAGIVAPALFILVCILVNILP